MGERVPTPAELVARVVRFVGEILGASSLRFEVGPTLVILGVLLVFLQLVARPVSRWVTSDAGGLAGLGRAMAMAAIATVMTLIFAYVYFGPFRALTREVHAQTWPAAGSALNRIRQLVATNLVLGLVTIAVAAFGGLLG